MTELTATHEQAIRERLNSYCEAAARNDPPAYAEARMDMEANAKLDIEDLLAELDRLRGKLADAWDEGAEYAWSETCEGFNGEYTGEAGTHDGKASFRSQMPEIENPYRKEDQS